MSLRVLTRPGDALGFRLAGVAVDEIAAGDEAAWFASLDPTIEVIAADAQILEALSKELRKRLADRGRPVLLPFSLPRRGEARPGREYVAALIRRAIGYHVKLGGPT